MTFRRGRTETDADIGSAAASIHGGHSGRPPEWRQRSNTRPQQQDGQLLLSGITRRLDWSLPNVSGGPIWLLTLPIATAEFSAKAALILTVRPPTDRVDGDTQEVRSCCLTKECYSWARCRFGFSSSIFMVEGCGHVVEGCGGGQRSRAACVVHGRNRCAAGASSTCPWPAGREAPGPRGFEV